MEDPGPSRATAAAIGMTVGTAAAGTLSAVLLAGDQHAVRVAAEAIASAGVLALAVLLAVEVWLPRRGWRRERAHYIDVIETMGQDAELDEQRHDVEALKLLGVIETLLNIQTAVEQHAALKAASDAIVAAHVERERLVEQCRRELAQKDAECAATVEKAAPQLFQAGYEAGVADERAGVTSLSQWRWP
jgi:hypothetical protein